MYKKLKSKNILLYLIFYIIVMIITLLGFAFWIMSIANLMNFHYTGEYLSGISNDVWVRFCYYWIWLAPTLGFLN